MKRLSRESKLVPLAALSAHTDAITFDTHHLPDTFDQERTLVHLAALNRFRSVAGIGTLAIHLDTEPAVENVYAVPELSPMFGYPDSNITLDAAQSTPTALNKNLKEALLSASRQANLSKKQAEISIAPYGGLALSAIGGVAAGYEKDTLLTVGWALAVCTLGVPLLERSYQAATRNEPKSKIKDAYRTSAFIGLAPDRYLASMAVNAASTYIRAAK